MLNIKEALLSGFNLDNIDLTLFNEEQFKIYLLWFRR